MNLCRVSIVFVKGAATVALAMVRLTVPPVFSTVKVAALELPMDTLPKLLEAGVMVAVTDGPVTPVPNKDDIFLCSVGGVGDNCQCPSGGCDSCWGVLNGDCTSCWKCNDCARACISNF
jgi:hypothetical protein